jgi:serine protease Do
LNWTGSSDQLDIFFVSDGDTTLIINDPNGNWLCNDDSDYSYDPQVTIYDPRQGQYDIWVGSYSMGNFFPGTLYITEMAESINPGTIEGNLPPESIGELDATLEPTFGETELGIGFSPNPFTVAVTSGADLDVWMMDINAGGYADSAPTFRLYWSGSTEQLTLSFVATGSGDTTLIILDPEGTYLYNDDSGGTLNPTVRIYDPPPGEYNIWVASYNQGQRRTGFLSITDAPSPQPDASLSPIFGPATLQAGFSPDPYSIDLSSGGPISIWETPIYEFGCAGYVTEAPTFRVNFSGSASRLRFFFMAEGQNDTTLLIQTPSGDWLCNDDSGYQDSTGYPYHPMVDISHPAAGIYNVWVSTLGGPTEFPGKLYITGQDRHPGNTP